MTDSNIQQNKVPFLEKSNNNITINPLTIIIGFILSHVIFFKTVMPFGFIFFSTTYRKGTNPVCMLIATSIGAFLSGGVNSIKYIIAAVIFWFIMQIISTSADVKTFHKAIVATTALAVTSAFFLSSAPFLLQNTILLPLECVLVFIIVLIMSQLNPVILEGIYPNSLESTISLTIVLILCAFGITNISIPADMSVIYVIAILIALLAAESYGAIHGAMTGLLLGSATVIGSYNMFSVAIICAVYGLSCGVFTQYGKKSALLAVLGANILLSFYLTDFRDSIMTISELLTVGTLFLLIPQNALSLLISFIKKKLIKNLHHQEQKNGTALEESEIILGRMKKKIETLLVRKPMKKRPDACSIINGAIDKVCKSCNKSSDCWGRSYSTTYSALMKLAPSLEEYGNVDLAALPSYFVERCRRISRVVDTIDRQYSAETMPKKVIRSAPQPDDSVNLPLKIEFDSIMEQEIIGLLRDEGLRARRIVVIKDSQNHYRIEATIRACGDENSCLKKLIPIAENVTKRRMGKTECLCASIGDSKSNCVIRLTERERYCIDVGSAQMKLEEISGDTFSVLPYYDGRCIMALSDGMGSGGDAARQSGTAVDLIESFLKAGFDRIAALRLINSMLGLKISDETFATIDITIIDMFVGTGEFIKMGANPTYVKHGNTVWKIASGSLPAGILRDVDAETTRATLNDGDAIIMLSDGIENAAHLWISNYIQPLPIRSAEELANMILEEAKIQNKGIVDDMTVIVAIVKDTSLSGSGS